MAAVPLPAEEFDAWRGGEQPSANIVAALAPPPLETAGSSPLTIQVRGTAPRNRCTVFEPPSGQEGHTRLRLYTPGIQARTRTMHTTTPTIYTEGRGKVLQGIN